MAVGGAPVSMAGGRRRLPRFSVVRVLGRQAAGNRVSDMLLRKSPRRPSLFVLFRVRCDIVGIFRITCVRDRIAYAKVQPIPGEDHFA